MQKIDPSACRSCGACCSGGYADDGWADCTLADVLRMSRAVRKRLLTRGLRTGRAIEEDGMVIPTNTTGACIFLRGTPGRRASCGIYATRPEVCRAFKPGSRACREARQDLFSALEEEEAE